MEVSLLWLFLNHRPLSEGLNSSNERCSDIGPEPDGAILREDDGGRVRAQQPRRPVLAILAADRSIAQRDTACGIPHGPGQPH